MTAVQLPLENPLGQSITTALTTALGAGRAGYGKKPSAGGVQSNGSFNGYAIVYPGQTVPGEGTAAAPNADGRQTVQVTYVGADADQADKVRDLGRLALLTTGALAITGRALIAPLELVDSTQARKDESVQPTTWFAVDRYVAHTTPS